MKLPFGFELNLNRSEKQSPREASGANTSVRAYRDTGGWWPEDIIERNPALQLPRRFRTYRRFIRSVPIIGAFAELYRALVAQTKFSFDGQDDRASELLGALLEAQPLRWLSDGLLYGFSVLEWQSEMDWTIKNAWQLPPETVIDATIEDNEVISFRQHLYTGEYFTLPAWKSAYVVRGVPPYGDGILMNVADSALRFLQNAALVAAAAEVNLQNNPDWSIPDGVKSDDKTLAEIRKVFSSSRAAFRTPVVAPSDLQIAEGMDGSRRLVATPQYNRVYPPRADINMSDLRESYEREAARVLGMEAFMLGENSVGSFALADVQSGAFVNLVRGGVGLVRDALQDVLNFQYMMTGGGDAPEVTADWSEFTQSETWGELLEKLSRAGVMFTAESKAVQQVLERAGLETDGLEVPDEDPENQDNSGNSMGDE